MMKKFDIDSALKHQEETDRRLWLQVEQVSGNVPDFSAGFEEVVIRRVESDKRRSQWKFWLLTGVLTLTLLIGSFIILLPFIGWNAILEMKRLVVYSIAGGLLIWVFQFLDHHFVKQKSLSRF